MPTPPTDAPHGVRGQRARRFQAKKRAAREAAEQRRTRDELIDGESEEGEDEGGRVGLAGQSASGCRAGGDYGREAALTMTIHDQKKHPNSLCVISSNCLTKKLGLGNKRLDMVLSGEYLIAIQPTASESDTLRFRVRRWASTYLSSPQSLMRLG
eukprot:GHVN01096048.1.p1 GENE.GHVN01096048.1~~GHVN01096048.1.p1  ORF type:complete len:155 (+),score=36.65 GHVN01096048.1:67-531(+)